MPSKKHPPLQTTKLDGQDLDEVNSYKYLGININSKLNWNQQWDHVYDKIRTAPYLLRQLRQLGFREPILAIGFKLERAEREYNITSIVPTRSNEFSLTQST